MGEDALQGLDLPVAYTRWKSLEHVERYAKRRYRSWDQRWLDQREKRVVRGLFRRYGISRTILDIPVGYGRFLPLLQEFGPVFAVDRAWVALVYQKNRVGLARGAARAVAEKLPFKDDSAEVVFCFRLLQHMHESGQRVTILREFHRVSKKWVVLSVYLSRAIHRAHRIIVPQPSRITMVRKGQFEREIEAAGLSLVEKVSVVPGLHAHRVFLLSTG